MRTPFLVLAAALLALSSSAQAFCPVATSGGGPAPVTHDVLGRFLNSPNVACAAEVFALRAALKNRGLDLATTLVANRGFHNPSQGSFSMFEMVLGPGLAPGDFFFGHFTAADDQGHLIADQSAEKGSLMIEAFAWDDAKGYYNFYELRGDGEKGQWFYRGDSRDILSDVTLLHRQPDPGNPKFGGALRCSACHTAGGPIMKELFAPHNDWWEPVRKLDFGGRAPDPALANVLETLVPADRLAAAVQAGLKKLAASVRFQDALASHTLQERLRPLFCPVEVNFKSDDAPQSAARETVRVPGEFFADARLVPGDARVALVASRSDYEAALSGSQSHFPETDLPDADHAWLTPVKAASDKLAVEALIDSGVIDRAFAAAVLAVDLTNPVTSGARCGLLKAVPDESSDWRSDFIARLRQSGQAPALELVRNLTDPTRTLEFQQSRTAAFLSHCRARLTTPEGVAQAYALLTQRRNEIRASEISKNPRGQILEPGFRVIFPETTWNVAPGRLRLSETCEVIDTTR